MSLIKSFYYAICGIGHCIKHETNFRIHIVAMITVIVFSCIYDVPHYEKAILTILISLVMVAELINTSIEAMVDKISPEKSKNAQIAKDTAAGAVLVFASSAVICAVFLFSDIEKWVKNIIPVICTYWYLALIYVILSWFFIFKCGAKKINNKG